MAHVLIVDDVPDSVDPLKVFLEQSGHKIVVAANGQEALVEVIKAAPDAVVLDLLMPEMDGPSFIEVARSYLRLQSLPIIVLTALTEGPFIDRARAMHVSAILVKGKATLEEIKAAIEASLHTLPPA